MMNDLEITNISEKPSLEHLIQEAILKVNGKGGQPVFIKLAEQTSGRCTPK